MSGSPRLEPIPPGTRPELADLEQVIMGSRGRVSVLYQVLLNSPPMAQGWEQLLSAVRNQNSLVADLRELIILRVAVLNRASYEFDALFQEVRAKFQGQNLLDLCITIASYNMVSRLLVALHIGH